MGKQKKPAKCKVPGCKAKETVARTKCQKHYRAELREEKNGRLEQYANRYDEPRVTLSTRVKVSTKEILEATGVSAYLAGSKALDDYAEELRRKHVAA